MSLISEKDAERLRHDICVMCKGTGEILSNSAVVPGGVHYRVVPGGVHYRSMCSACAGKGKIKRPYRRDNTRTNPFLIKPMNVQKYEDIALLYRHMAGVWYMRIVHPEMGHLIPLDDAMRVGTDRDQHLVIMGEGNTTPVIMEIYRECRALAESVGACLEARTFDDTLKRYQVDPERDGDFWWYVNLAMIDYRRRTPRARAQRRWQKTWLEFTDDYMPTLDEEVGYVVCTTCRKRLIGFDTLSRDRDFTDATNYHTTACALYTWWTQAPINPKTMARMSL